MAELLPKPANGAGGGQSARRIDRTVSLLGRITLGLLAAVVLGTGLLLHIAASKHHGETHVLELVSEKRAMTLRLAALLAATPTDTAHLQDSRLAELRAAHASLAAAHAALMASSSDAPAALAAEPELAAHYLAGPNPLAPRVEAFLAESLRLLERAGTEPPAATIAAIEGLRAEALGPLAEGLDQAVLRHAAGVERAHHEMEHRLLATIGLVLLFVGGLWLLLVRPLARRITHDAVALVRAGTIDPLTGLPNRHAFLAGLETQLRQAEPTGTKLGVLVIDLDWFKEVNDSEGHAAGDAVLRDVADKLRRTMRQHDLICRLGGDEFAVACPNVGTRADLERLAERLCRALSQPVSFANRLLRTGATIGLAVAPDDADNAERILHAADTALRNAKRQGRGQVAHFTTEHGAVIALERAIRAALEDEAALEGVHVALQPQIACDDGRVIGFEALARWTHPTLGNLSPATFIAIAEASGQLGRLSGIIRDRALAAIAEIRATHLPQAHVAINLSTAEVCTPGLCELVEKSLAAHGLPHHALELELTEGVLLERISDGTRDALESLHASGVRLALDDFGTGYSGIPALQKIPFSVLKIDRSFVRDVQETMRTQRILLSIVGLANGLAVDTIAEGVETPEEMSFVKAVGCTAAQGYLTARPMALPGLRAWLDERLGRTGAAAASPSLAGAAE